ncbi:hypothetical protein SDC9_104143 [bioreactor metagenome]|uniref:HTH cro/C1-type domain-containing protein n=1 Tax=bioreactor metagenome TaxID=1076179 RepID=A0A645AYC9_9ZZZZ
MLGGKIKELREQLGITSQELAEQANVSQPYISQIENDRRQPSYNTLQAIAYALNTSIDYFLGSGSAAASLSQSDRPVAAPAFAYQQKAPAGYIARETINLNSLVDYALAIDNASRAGVTPQELYDAVEALKKLKRLRRYE